MRTDAEKLKQDVRDAKEEKERVEIKIIDLQERLKVIEAEKAKFEGNVPRQSMKMVSFLTLIVKFYIN